MHHRRAMIATFCFSIGLSFFSTSHAAAQPVDLNSGIAEAMGDFFGSQLECTEKLPELSEAFGHPSVTKVTGFFASAYQDGRLEANAAEAFAKGYNNSMSDEMSCYMRFGLIYGILAAETVPE